MTMIHSASDRKQVQRNEKKNRERRKMELADLRELVKSSAGRRVLWRLLEHCGVFRSIWSNSALIHFNEGKRDTGLFLMHEIAEADPNGLLTMMSEVNARDLAERIEQENAQKEQKQSEPDGSTED